LLSILFLAFIIVIVIQVSFYGALFTQFSYASEQPNSTKENPISVIISCKNEEKNIGILLTHLLKQKYPKFEIIVVDDASNDNTLSIIKEFSNQHKCIQFISIPLTATYSGNKKNAITAGIQKASYENLVFTDADCIPNSTDWISSISSQFSNKKQLVLGYGGYKKLAGWFNKLVRYETLLTAWQYFSYAKIGLPYMGVGRNIAYTKTLFNKADGFESHKHVKSGDDDLFVNQIGNKQNTAICWKKDSHTLSEPKNTISAWLLQKRRHVTTANVYKPIHQFFLGGFYLSQLLFISLSIFLLISGFQVKYVLFLIGFRYLTYYISLIPTTQKLDEKDLIWVAPFLEFFLILLQLRIFITNLFGKPKKW